MIKNIFFTIRLWPRSHFWGDNLQAQGSAVYILGTVATFMSFLLLVLGGLVEDEEEISKQINKQN